ncbi:MAG: acyl carrier protein [Candidatus Binatia bacterium]
MAPAPDVKAATKCPTPAEVRSHVTRLLCQVAQIPVEAITDGATIDGELRMESVAFVEIQVAIEEAYDIVLDPVYLIELNEFGAIVEHIYSVCRDVSA